MSKQIFLTGIVDEWTAEEARWSLTNTSEKEIDIFISNWGGSVNKGFEIANLIQGLEKSGNKKITTNILSHADSIATVIFLAAKKENRKIVDSSTLFIHEPRFMVFDEVTKQDADKMSAELEMQKNRIADYYVKNIEGLTKEEALSLMAGEVNMSKDKMLEYGIVGEVLPEFDIAAKRTLISNYKIDMGLFNTKSQEPLNTLAFNDGTMIAFNGELKEGSEVQKVGEVVDLAGEFTDNDGRTITLEANKVSKIEAAASTEETTEGLTKEDVVNLLADFETRLEAAVDAKIEAIRKNGSKQKVPKVENNQSSGIEIGTQASARANTQKMLKEIQAAKTKRQEI
jgi:ATP-dependent protease ClpP protease subunit